MTDLFNQFGGALSDFKMRNIDSAGLHEIIGEFAPLIGVATDNVITANSNKSGDDKANEVKTEIKQELDLNEQDKKPAVPVSSDSALDLSIKPDSPPLFKIVKVESLQTESVKRELDDTSMIDHSVYKKSRHSFDSKQFETRNSCSPVNMVNDTTNLETLSNKDLDEESSKFCKLLYEIKSVNDLKYYQCKLCPKVYDTKYHLNRHLISHGGNRPHLCLKCGKSFSQKCDLNRHMNVHNNLRKHACSVCGKTFKRADYLSKHERQYCGVYKPHKCTKCYKGFEELEQLKEHNCNQKTDGITFTCEHCSEKFDSVDSLVDHRKTHQNKKQEYQCTKCKDDFTDFASYVDHFKVCCIHVYLNEEYIVVKIR